MLKPGQVVKKFKSKKGKDVVVRVVKKNDAQGLLDMINSVIAEDDFILLNKKQDIKQEKKWLNNTINKILKGDEILVCAVESSRIIGNCSIKKGSGRQSHIGSLGIVIMDRYREEGIGIELMKEILKLARTLKLKVITLDVLASNKRAQALYRKFGFRIYGKLPRGVLRKGKYVSDIEMCKELQ